MEEDLDKLLEITKQETIIDKRVPSPGCQEDIIQAEQPANVVSMTTIGNYLMDLMEIRCPRIGNFELLDGIDRVSNSIAGCINPAESALRKKKSRASFKKTTRKNKPTEDIFSSIDQIDEKIRHCLQLEEDTLSKKEPFDQEYAEFINPWASSNSKLEQDQAFIDYLDELDGPISEDELA